MTNDALGLMQLYDAEQLNSSLMLSHVLSPLVDSRLWFFSTMTQNDSFHSTGVDHSQLVDWAKSTLSFLPKGEPATKEAAKYHGGKLGICFKGYEMNQLM